MKTYILKLKTTSTTNYNLYDGTTLVSDSDLATLFGSAGSAYFTFDFNEGTPTNTTSLTILNSQDTAVMTNTGLEGIAEDRNFKGVWADSATAFTSFTLLKGVAMDEAELTTLVGMVKNAGGIKTLDYAGGTTHDAWTLDAGIYCLQNTTGAGQSWTLRINNSSSGVLGEDYIYISSSGEKTILVVADGVENTIQRKQFFIFRQNGLTEHAYTAANGSKGKSLKRILTSDYVIDNLTSPYSTSVLSANQGKILKDLIDSLVIKNAGAPTTATVGTVGMLYEDTTNGKLYQCTAVDNTDPQAIVYTWEEVGDSDVTTIIAPINADFDLGTLEAFISDLENGKVGFIYLEGAWHQIETYTLTASELTIEFNDVIYSSGYNFRVRNFPITIDRTDGSYSSNVSSIPVGQPVSVVQTTGTSTTDVMSQDAATKMVYVGGTTSTKDNICIGNGTRSRNVSTVSIGNSADASGIGAIAIGLAATAEGESSIALRGTATGMGAVAIGIGANATTKGTVDFGTSNTTTPSSYGYNYSNYRLLTGVYDPQSAHDAATKGYVDPTTDSSAPTTATVGRLGQIFIDATTATAYMCTAVDAVTPSYTWKALTA